MSKFLIFLSLISFVFFHSVSWAKGSQFGGAILLNPKAYSVQIESSLFLMTAQFNDAGVEVLPASASTFRLIDTDLKISYGISSNLEVSLFGKLRSINSYNGIDTAINTGAESVGVEAKYAFLPIDLLRYAIGIRYRQTLYTNTRYTISQTPAPEVVILGDDGSEYAVNFYVTYDSRPVKFDLKFGYVSPPNDLSSEIDYEASLHYKFSRLSTFAGLEGIYSLKRDQFTNDPSLKPLMSKGQSNLFNSLNREKLAPYIGANYLFDKFLLGIKGQTVLAGKSTDKGNTFFINLTWGSIGETPENDKIESFKEYHIDASVLKVSAQKTFVKIDQGLSTDVEKGAKFDIYQTDYFGGNVLVASGVVFEVGADWAVIKLTKKYKEIEIKPGFAARGL